VSQTIKTHFTSNPGIRNLSTIVLPLMLNNLSYNLMLFLDRLIIARSSTEEMNAAVTIGMACSIVLFSLSAIASTAEIFVGRYYGEKSFDEIGKPIWQMIWFSLASFIIFIPLGLFADALFIPDQYRNIGLSFFQWYMFGGPIFPLVMALTAFYIGRSQIKLVTFTIILSNIVNLILAIILVLGIDPWIPALGMKGAAIATIAAQIFQAIVLFSVFISKKYRDKYGLK
jgi:MATE family multidrug resistance protein